MQQRKILLYLIYTGRDHIQMDLHNNEVGQRIGMLIPHGPRELHQKLIDSAYVNTLNTLVINNASELRKESTAFPS